MPRTWLCLNIIIVHCDRIFDEMDECGNENGNGIDNEL